MKLKNYCSKLLVATLCIATIVGTVPVKSNAYSNISSKDSISVQSINDNSINISREGYDATLTHLSSDGKIVKYLIEENGIKYNMDVDLETDTVIINNNRYSLDVYNRALEEQNQAINSNSRSNLDMISILNKYEATNTQSVSNKTIIEENNSNQKATPPTSGYGGYYSAGTYKKFSMKYAMTAGAIGLIAAFVFPASAATATASTFVKYVLTESVKAGLIGGIVDTITGDTYFDKYQAYHNTEPAVREKRSPYTKIQNNTFRGNDFVWYFYSSRP